MRAENTPSSGQQVALYARASGADQKKDVERPLQRLRDYAAAHGYRIAVEVTEIASGLDDHRPNSTGCWAILKSVSLWWNIGIG